MTIALSWLLLAALASHAGAHITIAAFFARQRDWRRALLALLLPPLAPVWGWRAGMRAPVFVWTGALAIYALGVAAA
ncbi:MAG TPA: hypothetical protein VM925_05175 [Labilithrix sp.]|nr:hypothetical protein [Labilithrix sp.]